MLPITLLQNSPGNCVVQPLQSLVSKTDTHTHTYVLCAVRKVQEMCHGYKRVVECLDGCNAFVRIDGQHLGQQVNELASVRLFCQHVTALKVRGQVHLPGKETSLVRKVFQRKITSKDTGRCQVFRRMATDLLRVHDPA